MHRWLGKAVCLGLGSGLALGLVLAPTALGQEPSAARDLPFSDGGWDLAGEGTAIETFKGREVLRLETGEAFRRDVRLQDGTIDLDVRFTDRRSFVYLKFRMVEDGESEELYLRTHKSNLPDGLQYAPVWQGQSAWQLYHGPGGTAAVSLRPGVWTPVRLVLQGRHAAIFVGDLDTPALVVPRLARELRPGYIALRGFLPRDVPRGEPVARYANVRIRPGYVPFDFSSVDVREPETRPGTVGAWAVSRAFVPENGPYAQLPGAEVLGGFRRVGADPGGLVPLHSHVELPEGSRRAAAVARVRVTAREAGLRRLALGFSDEVTVFLNGRPLFHCDDSYSFDAPRRQGLLYDDQATLFLPLEKGENELAVLVSDRFGGWGLMGRFEDPDGLVIEAR